MTNELAGNLTNDGLARIVLQYILRSRGIVGENILLLALMRLQGDTEADDVQELSSRLSKVIKTINLKLHPLNYKVVRVSHGLGKNVVANKSEAFSAAQASSTTVTLPKSNRFFVYVDTGSVDETKLATRFSQREIEFIKWALQEISNHGTVIKKLTPPENCTVVEEVNRIRRATLDDPIDWDRFVSFTVGSSALSRFKELNALEIEQLIIKLCEYKWFSRNDKGEIGVDLRCIAELEENLITSYGLLQCENCDRLATQGVMCPHDGTASSIWHVDCYQHQISHVSQDCKICGKSLVTSGVYVI